MVDIPQPRSLCPRRESLANKNCMDNKQITRYLERLAQLGKGRIITVTPPAASVTGKLRDYVVVLRTDVEVWWWAMVG